MAAALLAVLTVTLSACGSSDNGGERPAGGISAHDEAILARIQTDVRGWNKAAAPWVKALGGDDNDRFLTVHQRALKPLNSAVAGIEGGSRQIADQELRELVVPIGKGYRGQFDAMIDIGDATRSGEESAVAHAYKDLRAENRRKGRAADRLVDHFPELGREY